MPIFISALVFISRGDHASFWCTVLSHYLLLTVWRSSLSGLCFFLIVHTLLCWTLYFLKLRITVANTYWELKHYKLLRAFYISLVFYLPLSNSLRNANIFIVTKDKGTYSDSLAEKEHKPMFLNHWIELLPQFTLSLHVIFTSAKDSLSQLPANSCLQIGLRKCCNKFFWKQT